LSLRSRGKESEYENMDSDVEGLEASGPITQVSTKRSESEQREIDDFEEEERKIISQESQV
jgi:hypothetical protein